ncbi:MAG: hypothetical protein JNK51_14535 [Blastocatellia bacterium]|nr:hypothetical protein [Chloracidobacterium sp.]MBL8186129.1 hypothetical protein [Blastocatellia bacterium]HBE82475.1 hypothetical protein [Blastocatellia bacterium]HRJ88514.1 hypothetical protein [Pyrinomonadaceae bacterium]HRK50439.1 hypothetical protein [Pyrinomonadaceae bacterium]
MAHSSHENAAVDLDLGYERNDIQIKGIVYFAVGLFVLVVITFGLMWALYGVLEDEASQRLKSNNPMLVSEKDRLPAEPRLQGAPGFGVDSPKGRVNLELTAPQSEYWELQKQWKDVWANGIKHPETGTLIVMPVNKAKEKYLSQPIKARSGPEAEQLAASSKMVVSDSSAGRMASETIR